MRHLATSGYEVPVSINVTAHCLPRLALPMRLLDALERHGVPARLLCLEITEDVLVADPDMTAEVLTLLRHAGIRCSVDDFGTGFSSLSYLRRLPLDELKIDRSFILGLFPHGPGGAVDDVVVGAVIDLGHRLGVHVVAEGVEHQHELDVLARWAATACRAICTPRPCPRPRSRSTCSKRPGSRPHPRCLPERSANSATQPHGHPAIRCALVPRGRQRLLLAMDRLRTGTAITRSFATNMRPGSIGPWLRGRAISAVLNREGRTTLHHAAPGPLPVHTQLHIPCGRGRR